MASLPPDQFWRSFGVAASRHAGGLSCRAGICSALMLVICWGMIGCERAGAAREAGSRRGATVQVVNLSDYAWTITLSRVGGSQSKTATLAPRATQAVIVPGGEYRIEQSASGGRAGPLAPRVLTASLESGASYRWPLTTLLSESETPVSQGASR